MASIIKVDSLQEKTSGNGIVLENSLKDSTGTNEIISPSGSITIPSGQNISNFASTGIDDNAINTTVTIDDSGKVGIGTASPSSKLHIYEVNDSSTNYLNTDATLLVTNTGTNSTNLKLEGTASIIYGNGSASLSIADRENERIHIDSSGVVSVPINGEFESIRNTFYKNNQFSMTGGGTITYSSTYYLSWSHRFICIANGHSQYTASEGYFDINMPPVGTTIHGIGGNADQTVTSNGIFLNYWSSLWYEPPIGGNHYSQDGNFYYGYYSSFNGAEIPDHWILLATVNGDSASGGRIAKLCNGKSIQAGNTAYPDTNWITPTLLNNWVAYSNDYGTLQYRRVDNVVYMKGLIKNGTSTTIYTLPVGFRPTNRLLMNNTTSPNVFARFDIMSDGTVLAYDYSSSWYSVVCSFRVD